MYRYNWHANCTHSSFALKRDKYAIKLNVKRIGYDEF